MSLPGLQPPPDPNRFTQERDFHRALYRWCYEVYRLNNGSGVTRTWAETAVDTTIATDILTVTAACTITIPTAVGRTGDEYTIDNSHAGDTTVIPTGAETIEDEVSQTLTGDAAMALYSDGTNWRIS